MTGGWPELERLLYDLRFAQIVEDDAKRTLVVQPKDEPRARALLAEWDLSERFKLVVSPWIPDATWFLIDEQAIQAEHEEAMQRMWLRPPHYPEGPSWPLT